MVKEYVNINISIRGKTTKKIAKQVEKDALLFLKTKQYKNVTKRLKL